jgi:hypothetical protein
MSSYFRTVSKLRDSRSLLKAIMERVGKLEQQVNTLETIDFRHYLRSNNDRILYVGVPKTEMGAVFLDPALKDYQMPMEPDGDKLTCWLKFLLFSELTAIDSSGFENAGTFLGTPEVGAGPIIGLPAVIFDGNDRLAVPNNAKINAIGTAIGFSVSFNFNPLDIAIDNGMPPILAAKTDDDPSIRHHGWMIWVEPTGALFFSVFIANIKFTASFSNAFPALNTWYKVVCTFDKPTVTPKIYINGVVSTSVTSTYTGLAQLPSSSLDMTIGGYDSPGFLKGMSKGMYSDVRYWREKVLTQTENDNFVANGLSISNIPENVARAGVGNFPAAILSIS